ncbi:MAG TPA: hypothetical protein PLU47_02375 [Azonexus sp.]|nr:hypothetical protein [Azonexus sp.]
MAERQFPWSASRVRLMNSTPEEFRRALLQAFGPAVVETAAGVQLAVDSVQLHFALMREESHRIGALHLAMLRVEISILDGDQNAAATLLARVDRATQRGGG